MMDHKVLLSAIMAAMALTALAGKVQPLEVDRAPRIDGKLTDACWKSAPVATDFLLFGSKNKAVATRKTEAKILYTNKSVVLGFKCHIPDDRFPKKDDPEKRPFLMDCVEIMLTPSESEDGFFHFTVNCFNRSSQQRQLELRI